MSPYQGLTSGCKVDNDQQKIQILGAFKTTVAVENITSVLSSIHCAKQFIPIIGKTKLNNAILWSNININIVWQQSSKNYYHLACHWAIDIPHVPV